MCLVKRKYRFSFRNKTRDSKSNRDPFDVRVRRLKVCYKNNINSQKGLLEYNLNTPILSKFINNITFLNIIEETRKVEGPTLKVLRGKSETYSAPFLHVSDQGVVPTHLFQPFSWKPELSYFVRKDADVPTKPEPAFVTLFEDNNNTHNILGLRAPLADDFIKEDSLNKKYLNQDCTKSSPGRYTSGAAGFSIPPKTTAIYNSNLMDKVIFGTCGFYFSGSGTISSKYIETARLAVSRKLKKSGRFWVRVVADSPVSARAAETRMGRGKGSVSYYEAKVRPGQMFMEFSGVQVELLEKIFKELTQKTSQKIQIKLI